jgi:hypothetical protein
MPAIKQVNVATTANALNGLKFDEIPSPGALVTLYASCVTAGDTIGFSVGSEDYLVDAEPNIESSADVVDTDRDAILVREPVGPGKAFLRITATTAVNFLLVLEYV